ITVSELAAAGVASVLVPLMVATTSHQRANAQFMAANDAAIHLPQSELNAPRLAELLTTLTRDRLLAMAHAAHSLGRPDATDRVAAVIEKVAA
ncbi:MAG: UDP-N-acetylglucosamine--N-acetylmuramyl-(pentapeptide) pyrophosphoryl-undecaprenol N-acetylglucosamine transferase, partial [Pseudomonadota bacterium]|nr:UDP-N-acetylglucosamine--N-acetylmuramyl-(pentapeptide) pyrophosphoryl-undecaprenol N-acetylglucosamine transferase [Pseudomonadota bacterium]